MDVMKILKSIPEWNDLRKLPAKVAELEKRLEALENQDTTLDICPKCKQATFELISSTPHPIFGDVGTILRTYKCNSCNFSEDVQFDPS